MGGQPGPAPIPYLGDDEAKYTKYPPAPIPYLEDDSQPQTIQIQLTTHFRRQDSDGEADEGGDDEPADTNEAHDDADRVARSVISPDTRIQIQPMTAQPYKWICEIITRTDTDNSYSGTGYLVNVPWANTGCILTAGHNLWMKNRSYARRLEITFPGKDTFTVSRDDTEQFFRASPEYVARFAKDHDYGAIVVPGLQSQGFGYSTLMTDDEISYATASVFGYPGDKEPRTMWGSGSKFLPPTTGQLHYDIDTFPGQSGSPVYVWLNGYWASIGIHTYGFHGNERFNHATRLTVEVMRIVLEWLKHPLQKVSLRAWDSPEKMVKIASAAGRSYTTGGTGLVVARFSPDAFTDLTFLPLESVPSPIEFPDNKIKVAIASHRFPRTYIHMSARPVFEGRRVQATGGGHVKCQPLITQWEVFHIMQDSTVPDTMNIESVKYPGVYLRLDSAAVNSTNLNGRDGSVNAQWTAGDLERFQEIRVESDGAAPDINQPVDDDGDSDLRKQMEELRTQLEDRDAKIRDLEEQKKTWQATNTTLAQVQTDLDRTKADLLTCQNAPPRTVTGPTQYVNVPGPTQYVNVPGPTQYVNVPGPIQYVEQQYNGFKASQLWTWAQLEKRRAEHYARKSGLPGDLYSNYHEQLIMDVVNRNGSTWDINDFGGPP